MNLPFAVERDASEVASFLVNYLSRTLRGSKIYYFAVDKDITAVIEAVQK